LGGPPVALVLSLVGLIRGQDRAAAVWGLALSLVAGSVIFLLPFLVHCLL
jgi:hypothetical protein